MNAREQIRMCHPLHLLSQMIVDLLSIVVVCFGYGHGQPSNSKLRQCLHSHTVCHNVLGLTHIVSAA